MSKPKKTEETETPSSLVEAVLAHLAYLEARGQHTSTTARKLAELVK